MATTNITYGQAAIAGIAGATALTGIHEVLRKIRPDAPRMDLLGMQSLSRLLKLIGASVPGRPALLGWTLLGDIGSNSFYYSLAAKGDRKKVWLKGTLLGLSAGLGAVLLPRPMRLNSNASSRTPFTVMATMAVYLVGGLVTAAVASTMSKETNHSKT